jgi:para-aminobenzoate synthetase / 4-amino-4-deoxychorismate lyase
MPPGMLLLGGRVVRVRSRNNRRGQARLFARGTDRVVSGNRVILLPSQYHAIVSNLADSILLETSRPNRENHRSFLFVNPAGILTAETLDDLPGLFERIEKCLAQGLYVAGFMSYECGYHFEPRAAARPPERSKLPLAWFGAYRQPFIFDHVSGAFSPELPAEWRKSVASAVPAAAFAVCDSRLEIERDEYCAKIEAIRDFIAAGDTYQVNFTTKALFDYSGSPAALFSGLRNQQKVAFAAYIHRRDHNILSFSPELFFRIQGGRLATRPMKGTARRGRTLAEDARIENWLRDDPKNRSENVMIVDLLRNDVGKIAETGSIRVDELFAVEKYETLFQMTSTVSGTLCAETRFYDIFRAIFPSGSVTGAPKCRTMQIIQELEQGPRGVYTGAIGYISPARDAAFSVPIRTLVLKTGIGEMGVGSGIVYDSIPLQEYDECLLKMEFFAHSQPSFQLIESLRWDGTYHFLRQHLERLKSSAEYFGFPCSETEVTSRLEENQSRLGAGEAYKVRLLLDAAGEVAIGNVRVESEPPGGTVTVSSTRMSSQDRFLFHKTTCRDVYEREHAEARRQGHTDVLFMNEKGELTEAANNNLFVEIGGIMFTPPIECGLLPGIYRQHVLESEPRTFERVLTVDDLKTADAIYLCNSVRGLRRVTLV